MARRSPARRSRATSFPPPGWIRSRRPIQSPLEAELPPARVPTTSTTSTRPCRSNFRSKNFSDRADYQVTDKLRASGRVSLFRTPITTSNPTGSDYFVSDRGSERDATSITGDVTYTLNARTVLNVRGDYHSFIDASKYATSFADGGGWAKVWPELQLLQRRLSGSGRAGSAAPHVDFAERMVRRGISTWVQEAAIGIRRPTADSLRREDRPAARRRIT